MIRLVASAALLALAGCTLTAPDAGNATQYVCTDGTKLAAIYGKDGDSDTVTLSYQGEVVHLVAEMAASGVRYGWPSDGSNYVWWTKGDQATLYWKDGEKGGLETVLHDGCTAQ